MYAYGYRNLEKARFTLDEARLSGLSCADCSVCNINCTAGFNIREKVSDIARLLEVPKEFLKA